MTTNTSLPEVPAIDVADALLRAHGVDEPGTAPVNGRFLRAAMATGYDSEAVAAVREEAAAHDSMRVVAEQVSSTDQASPVERVPSIAFTRTGDGSDQASSRRAPRTVERALLELALIPEAGWPDEQAKAFLDAARAGGRTPSDVVEIIEFLRSWRALPKTVAAAAFACDLLASKHPVADLKHSVGGVWSYSRRQARALGAELEPVQEAQLVRAVLEHPRQGAHVLRMLDAVDNEGGFSRYRPELRIQALDAALRSDATPQDALQWALDARRIGIDDDADVAVFVRLLTQQ